jgi:hypothetical protein
MYRTEFVNGWITGKKQLENRCKKTRKKSRPMATTRQSSTTTYSRMGMGKRS